MSTKIRILFAFLLFLAFTFVIRWGWRAPEGPSGQSALAPASGGRLVATLRSEPVSFNRLVSPTFATDVFARLTQATLVRVNRATGTLEPRLAREWETSSDGLSWTLHLIEDATFADGTPFTSADVAFTFEALYDERVGSELASSLRIDGRPISVETPDPATVVLRLPAPYGPGLAILESAADSPAAQAGRHARGRRVQGRLERPDATVGPGRPRTVRAVGLCSG